MLEWVPIALALSGQPSAAAGGEPDAQMVAETIDEATELAARGRHVEALDVVTRARDRVDDPRLTYMEAQLLRFTGDCDAAIERYHEFLETDPDSVDRQYARASIEECGGDPDAAPPLPAQEPTVREPEPEPAAFVPPPSAVVDDPAPTNAGRAPVQRSPRATSIGLLIGGGAGVLVGAGLLGAGFGVRGAAVNGGLTLERYQDRERTAAGLGASGIVVMSVGAAVLTAGLIHALATKRRRTQARVAAW